MDAYLYNIEGSKENRIDVEVDCQIKFINSLDSEEWIVICFQVIYNQVHYQQFKNNTILKPSLTGEENSLNQSCTTQEMAQDSLIAYSPLMTVTDSKNSQFKEQEENKKGWIIGRTNSQENINSLEHISIFPLPKIKTEHLNIYTNVVNLSFNPHKKGITQKKLFRYKIRIVKQEPKSNTETIKQEHTESLTNNKELYKKRLKHYRNLASDAVNNSSRIHCGRHSATSNMERNKQDKINRIKRCYLHYFRSKSSSNSSDIPKQTIIGRKHIKFNEVKCNEAKNIDKLLKRKNDNCVTLRYIKQDRIRRSIITAYNTSRNAKDCSELSSLTKSNNILVRNITLKDYVQCGLKNKFQMAKDTVRLNMKLKSSYRNRSRETSRCLDSRKTNYSVCLPNKISWTSIESYTKQSIIDWVKTPFFQRVARDEYSLPNFKADFINELSIDPLILLLKRITKEDLVMQAKRAYTTLKYLSTEITGVFKNRDLPKNIDEIIDVLNECKRLFKIRCKLLPIFMLSLDYFVYLIKLINRNYIKKKYQNIHMHKVKKKMIMLFHC